MARRGNVASKSSRPGRLRIVAGKWRSRLLPVADLDGLRPTSERIRETLFNWLSADIVGSHCLDLFAGSGALGFEALSRNAASATLLDQSPLVTESLQSSARILQADNARIECTDTLAWLQRAAHRQYDIAFIDPPFAEDCVEDCCRLLHSNGWLDPGATIYIEQDKKQPMPELPGGWRIEKNKNAGDVRYMLVRMSEGETGDSIRDVPGNI